VRSEGGQAAVQSRNSGATPSCARIARSLARSVPRIKELQFAVGISFDTVRCAPSGPPPELGRLATFSQKLNLHSSPGRRESMPLADERAHGSCRGDKEKNRPEPKLPAT
jgi:hypothetical protein